MRDTGGIYGASRSTLIPASGMRQRAPKRLLAEELWVPIRTSSGRDAFALQLDSRSMFVLLHVDGMATLAQIAQMSGISPEEVATTLLELESRGLLSISGHVPLSRPAIAPPPADSEVRVAKRSKRR
jgi:hypothetical protein